MSPLVEAILLVVVANGAPILVRLLPMADRFTYPLDCRLRFIDGERILGDSKTWRGLLASVFATALCSVAIQTGWVTGIVVALTAMIGDSLSSFIKRRLGLAPSTMAVGLDQIPESLLPFIFLHFRGQLTWPEVGLLLILFVVSDLLLSQIFFRLHIRKRPY